MEKIANTNRAIALLTVTLLCLIAMTSCGSKQQPNIIVILADDAGYADFGFMGSTDLETPNIDKLAADGVIFTDAHVSATVCAPSRAGLLTGRYQQRSGFECNVPPHGKGLGRDEKTIGNALQAQGYKTIAIGKWHVGETEEHHPNNRGFHEFYGFLGGSRSYFKDEKVDKEGNPHAILHNKQRVDFKGYLTDVFGDKAVEYIQQSDEQPFFMYLAFNAVHTPMHAKEEHLKKYEDHSRQQLAAMTWSFDENVGKVVTQLKKQGIYENTLIFFLSDNGGAYNNQSSCLPLKGWKGNKFEGGHRVPFFITYPSKVTGGQVFNGLTSAFDIFATSINVAGVRKHHGLPIDGVNLMPFLNGKKTGNPHEVLFWRKDEMAGARYNEYKLIRLENYGYRLYNLEEDLEEKIDLQYKNDDVFHDIADKLEAWENKMMEPLWLEEEKWNVVTYEIHQALMENRKPKYSSPWSMNRYYKMAEK